ncbi:FMN-binding protein [Pseudonocardia aurantiaca]|uniref:FMN-binding protein n=1 Tax=Pseudonocardia aurantiaca TaxID=75290 RepID=A0ABW4FKF3_9PSEU
MRKIAVAIASTICGLVLLFTYPTSTGQTVAAAGALPVALPPNESSLSSGGVSAPLPQTSNSSSGPGTGGAGGTFAGSTSKTRYGPVQVQISVTGGRITAATLLQVPHEAGRTDRINSQAVPILNQETVQAQSAQIDTVSGATYTSDGYMQSLQSAIDAAHLG